MDRMGRKPMELILSHPAILSVVAVLGFGSDASNSPRSPRLRVRRQFFGHYAA
jgi:hypothetical protein